MADGIPYRDMLEFDVLVFLTAISVHITMQSDIYNGDSSWYLNNENDSCTFPMMCNFYDIGLQHD